MKPTLCVLGLAAILTVSSAAPAHAQCSDTALVFAHDFETIAGSTVTAQCGPNAAKSSGLAPTPACTGQCLRSPARGVYQTVDTSTRLSVATPELSFSILYNAREDAFDQVKRFLSTFGGSGGVAADEFIFDRVPGGRLRVITGGQSVESDGTIPEDNAWHQAAFRFQNGTVRFFLDGVPFGTDKVMGLTAVSAQARDWHLVEDALAASNATEYFNHGEYDEARLWTRALSDAELKAQYVGCPVQVASLQGVAGGKAKWGDYDGDGDLDVLLIGAVVGGVLTRNAVRETRAEVTQGTTPFPLVGTVYRNDGGSFTDTGAEIEEVYGSDAAWGDYDGDGDLDILLAGLDSASVSISRIYRNDAGTFSDIGAVLPGVTEPALAWGDIDNDGDLDALVAGLADGTVRISRLYRNDAGTFHDVGAGLLEVAECGGAFGDYDNDGDLDLVLAGRSASSVRATRLYRNDGGSFVDTGAALEDVSSAAVAWGDYDNDGDLDLFLSGFVAATPVAKVYRNDAGSFNDVGAVVGLGPWYGASWGDYDNDGDLDLLLVSPSNSNGVQVFRNDGGTFAVLVTELPMFEAGSGDWGDFDGDGDLDILLTGSEPGGFPHTFVYAGLQPSPNTPPTAPSGLSAIVNGPVVTFSWVASSDSETPAAGLSYNLRIGSSPDGDEISSGMADPTTGVRYVSRLGNTNQNLSWDIDLDAFTGVSTIYWGVQAIDHSFEGSPFSSQVTVVTVGAPEAPTPACLALAVGPNPFGRATTIAFDLPAPESVTLRIRDVAGRRVRMLRQGLHTAGRHVEVWDGTDAAGRGLPAGVYFVRLHAGGESLTRRLVLLGGP